MPWIFRNSKINLNMTIKPIRTGLPLRIFDILGCGGFCMTNYQEELEDLFRIGTDLEAYGSPEELEEKCAYYLTHEEERQRIAANGYRKAAESHTAWSAGAKGCIIWKPASESGCMSAAALSFMVHEPKEIIELASEMSLSSSFLM